MIILAKTRNTISLINVISILLYLSIKPQTVQTCRAASSHTSRPYVPYDSEKSSIYKYITPTAVPLISSTLLDTLQSTPQTATNTYLQHTISLFTEHAISSSIGAEADGSGHSSTAGSGIARSCLDPKEYYDMCLQQAIIKSPHLAVRYAGRILRVSQICRRLALRHLEKCQTNV